MYPDAAVRGRKAGGAVGAFRSYRLLLIRRRLLGDNVPSPSPSSIIKSPSVSSCNVVARTVPAVELAGVDMVFVVAMGNCRELLENDEFTEEECGGETPVATDE